jgi:2-polyprenyl-3-methyl-5-hydroxy-6-metoxy-1,4-benzoquinol methylase
MKPETTNFEKFQTGNPIVRRLIGRFFGKVRQKVSARPFSNMLDAGCGEGMTLYQLNDLVPETIAGFDLNPTCVEYTKNLFPDADITVQDIYKLPYAVDSFDLVLCMEVLEHLPNPDQAIKSLKHVARGRLIFSVPHEPWFRLGSLCRGKYLKSFGNHPEHINHWSPASFKAFLEQEFENVEVDTSFPWIIAEVRLADSE